MKYFEKHLKMTDSADDIDISVHWDIKIFEWLMDYINDRNPKLQINNVIPILISADFLVMGRLIDDWISFIVKNLTEIVKIPIDMSCLNQSALKSISESVTLEELDAWKDPRDSLQSKLFMHKLEQIMKEEANILNKWMYWNILFVEDQAEWMTCPRAELFIDYRGRAIANHVPDKNWDYNEFFSYIRKNGVSWRRIFWKVWARLKSDECTVCNQRFTLAEIDHCTYHSEPPKFTYGSNIGTFEWCGSEAIRFSTSLEQKGCQAKSHVPKNIKESSLEWKFLEKHKELLAEPASLSGKNQESDNEETKTQTENDKTEEQSGANQSHTSLIKSQRRKFKLMSLMEMLLEFVNNKTKKRSCENCRKIGSLCNKCYGLEDEDCDDREDDLNLVNPKFTKNLSTQSNASGAAGKKIKKMPSGENKGPSESKSIKMKYWKYDFYRDQDREKMDLLTKKLTKMRK